VVVVFVNLLFHQCVAREGYTMPLVKAASVSKPSKQDLSRHKSVRRMKI